MRNFLKKFIIICLLTTLVIPGIIYSNDSDEPGPIGFNISQSVSF